jgi:hypothetical protein
MKTEARKLFSQGFNLTEEEFRRIVDTATEKVRRKLPEGSQPWMRFELKYKNGTTTELDSVEAVLAEENVGPKQIVRIWAWFAVSEVPLDNPFAPNTEPSHMIRFRFVNPRVEDDEPWAVLLYIKGEDRDWVLVTASELGERIAKVKCLAVPGPARPRSRSLLVPIFLLLSMISFGYGVFRAEHSTGNVLEERWKAGTLRDPIEAAVLLERRLNASRLGLAAILTYLLAVPAIITGTIALVVPMLGYLHPSYAFAWGDYTKVLSSRARLRQFVYGGVVATLILSVIAGVIANRISAR